ncbi:hypothetical protein GH714_010306 [Hevea brasiliensis]|uniref:Reverse transcriptase domain-containing protein n=1 Tax=Hevea brasiliensis TaxID=3981 RepID=A0A6A6LN76_HEVBR|nr:hypothetical protein GH714_010306 [Hevea brasiliensis]
MKESLWRPKSRVQWVKEGDKNTKFFHLAASNRRRKNFIGCIKTSSGMVTDVNGIRAEAVNDFTALFSESDYSRPSLLIGNITSLPPSSAELLEAPFSYEEIQAAVWYCGNGKAPGPDGFNFSFFKASWDFIWPDIMRMVDEFFRTSCLSKGNNSSFVTLAPKISGSSLLLDYRPISLIGSLYKIVAKTLANRLRVVIGQVIGSQQSAFIRGRQILDGALIAREAIHSPKKKNHGGFMFKVDFQKAFNSVNLRFLLSIMEQMGFGPRCCGWIRDCLTAAKISVLINGSPTQQFSIAEGLR